MTSSRDRVIEPSVDDLAVTVDELYPTSGPGGLLEPSEPGVPSACRRERNTHVQLDDFDSPFAGSADRIVSRRRVDVDHDGGSRSNRVEATSKALAFVAADDHDPEVGIGFSTLRFNKHSGFGCG